MKVRERPKGSGVRWLFIDHNGRRKAKKVGRNKKLALDAAEKIQAKLRLRQFDITTAEKKAVPLFRDYAGLWLQSCVRGIRPENTYRRYSAVLKG